MESHDATNAGSVAPPFIERRRIPRVDSLDRVTVGYICIATVVLIAHFMGWRGASPTAAETVWLLVAHLLVIALAILAPISRARAKTHSFLAEWYPAIVMGGLYSTVGLLNSTSGSIVTFDGMVQNWELAVFGRMVAYDWIRAMPNPALSAVLHLCYLSYYVLVLVAPLGFWFTRKRGEARQAIFAASFCFFVCYAVFLVFPVAGPFYFWPFPDNAATRIWPAELVHRVVFRGDAYGSAFPSSHVAVSVVATFYAFRGSKVLGWILLVPTIGIFFGVVYSQIHYGVDALAGLAVGLGVSLIVPHIRSGHDLTAGRRVGDGALPLASPAEIR
ncbi:MAG: phosphatase PAP2 family protein [Gemmatimonadota bacterium]